jgi:predicted ATPase
MSNRTSFFVITGGPGSGKSTLLSALAARGCSHTVEAGRAIIRAQTSIGGSALPWADRELFAELMLSWEMRSFESARERDGITFFDRGVPDVVGYLQLIGAPIPAHVHRAAQCIRYEPRVFIAPPWAEIYVQDDERKQDFGEAQRTYDALAATYAEYGYELCVLPLASVEARVQFVLDKASLREGLTARAVETDETLRQQ